MYQLIYSSGRSAEEPLEGPSADKKHKLLTQQIGERARLEQEIQKTELEMSEAEKEVDDVEVTTTYEELLTIFQRRKTQLQHELDQIVENLLASSRLHKEIVTLQDFERFGIPLKESPRNELLASM